MVEKRAVEKGFGEMFQPFLLFLYAQKGNSGLSTAYFPNDYCIPR
jgi:hypothetical protein